MSGYLMEQKKDDTSKADMGMQQVEQQVCCCASVFLDVIGGVNLYC